MKCRHYAFPKRRPLFSADLEFVLTHSISLILANTIMLWVSFLEKRVGAMAWETLSLFLSVFLIFWVNWTVFIESLQPMSTIYGTLVTRHRNFVPLILKERKGRELDMHEQNINGTTASLYYCVLHDGAFSRTLAEVRFLASQSR